MILSQSRLYNTDNIDNYFAGPVVTMLKMYTIISRSWNANMHHNKIYGATFETKDNISCSKIVAWNLFGIDYISCLFSKFLWFQQSYMRICLVVSRSIKLTRALVGVFRREASKILIFLLNWYEIGKIEILSDWLLLNFCQLT